MTISLKHAFTSAKADGPDSTNVQPSNWNAEHVITMATARLMGRTTAGTGAVEEISVGSGLSLTGGVLDLNSTVSALAITALTTTSITYNGTLLTPTAAQFNRLADKLSGTPVTVTDWNNATEFGQYYAAAAATNAPTTSEAVHGVVGGLDSNNCWQLVFGLTSGSTWKRQKKAGTWETTWVRLPYHSVQITANIDNLGAGSYFGYVDQTITGTLPSGLSGDWFAILEAHGTTSGGREQRITFTSGVLKGQVFVRVYDPTASAWASWGRLVPITSLSRVGLLGGQVTGVAQLDLALDSSYPRFELELRDLFLTTAGATLRARVSTDSGATYISTATYNSTGNSLASGSTVSTAMNAIGVTAFTMSREFDTTVSANAAIRVLRGGSRFQMYSDVFHKFNGAADHINTRARHENAVGNVTHVRIFASSGNLTCRYDLVGVRDAA